MSRLNGHTLAVGDDVAIVAYQNVPRFSVVKRVLRSFVELENGSKWTVCGARPYPRSTGGYSFPSLEYPVTQERRDEHRRCVLVAYMRNRKWDDTPLAALELVNDALRGLK